MKSELLPSSVLPDEEQVKHITDKDLLFNLTQKSWLDFTTNSYRESEASILQHFHHYEAIARQSNKVYCLLDINNFKALAFTENVYGFCGYTNKELVEGNMRRIFDIIAFRHLKVFWQLPKWIHTLDNHLKTLSPQACYNAAFYGLTAHTKNKGAIQIMLRHFQPPGTKLQSIVLAEINDISHLINSKHYWFRAHIEEDNSVFTFSSAKRKIERKDFFTNREKEILACLIHKMDNEEIAKQLFISPQTLSTHRKNMIRKLGVKDTISMIEICKSTGIMT